VTTTSPTTHSNRPLANGAASGTEDSGGRWIRLAILLLAVFGLVAAGCGGDDDGASETDEPTAEAEATAEAEPEAPADGEDENEDEDEGAEGDSGDADGADTAEEATSACSQATAGPEGSYIVVDIPADDPDGGLVAHSAPGVDAPVDGVFPADYSVYFDGSLDSCTITSDGGVWWNVADADFSTWVNASYLGKYNGPGDREAVGTPEALCDAYIFVIDAQETDIPITAQLIALDVELGGGPTGVSAAINDLINGTGNYTEAYDTISGYVGPICAG